MSTYSSLFNQQVEVVEQKDVVSEDEAQEDAGHEDIAEHDVVHENEIKEESEQEQQQHENSSSDLRQLFGSIIVRSTDQQIAAPPLLQAQAVTYNNDYYY